KKVSWLICCFPNIRVKINNEKKPITERTMTTSVSFKPIPPYRLQLFKEDYLTFFLPSSIYIVCNYFLSYADSFAGRVYNGIRCIKKGAKKNVEILTYVKESVGNLSYTEVRTKQRRDQHEKSSISIRITYMSYMH